MHVISTHLADLSTFAVLVSSVIGRWDMSAAADCELVELVLLKFL